MKSRVAALASITLTFFLFAFGCGDPNPTLVGQNNRTSQNNANNENNENNTNNGDLKGEGQSCSQGNECLSGTCRFGQCTGSTCFDGVQNGEETDVDCGAIGCAPCGIGKGCEEDSHCISGICGDGTCLDKNCNDGLKNGLETDVDCGGLCGPCADSQVCVEDSDCESGNCDGERCAQPTCDDKIANGNETDVDCGGSCGPCADGLGCAGAGDCQNGVCEAGACASPSCTDGILNGQETDTDCGGPVCPACENLASCDRDDDCVNNLCDDATKTCSEASCIDGTLNGEETDTDCGGADCNAVDLRCRPGRNCLVGEDCQTGVCDPVTFKCLQPTCEDGVQNGTETDVDCGGRCGPCGDDKNCSEEGDCLSLVCSGGTCEANDCSDGVLNGNETDVDCGGPDCGKCAAGQDCNTPGECISGVCESGRCRAPACNDGVQNGLETDVDCGGVDCDACADGSSCSFGEDCVSRVCDSTSECVAPTCSDGVLNGDETDVDCGGPDCPTCGEGESCSNDIDCESGICDGGPNQDSVCAECRENSSETVDLACGFKGRGNVEITCQNGVWVNTGCADEWFASCAEIISITPQASDGLYTLDPDGPGGQYDEFEVFCDMTTDGGGWTEILPCTAKDELNGVMVAVDPADTASFDGCKPRTRDGSGAHTYHYTFDFPAGFSQFFFSNYEAKAYADVSRGDTSEFGWLQTSWQAANGGGAVNRGDISFGSGNAAGPITSYSRFFGQTQCGECVLPWTQFGPSTPFDVPGSATKFRIGWGESGPQHEGWYPWWSGGIRLR